MPLPMFSASHVAAMHMYTAHRALVHVLDVGYTYTLAVFVGSAALLNMRRSGLCCVQRLHSKVVIVQALMAGDSQESYHVLPNLGVPCEMAARIDCMLSELLQLLATRRVLL